MSTVAPGDESGTIPLGGHVASVQKKQPLPILYWGVISHGGSATVLSGVDPNNAPIPPDSVESIIGPFSTYLLAGQTLRNLLQSKIATLESALDQWQNWLDQYAAMGGK